MSLTRFSSLYNMAHKSYLYDIKYEFMYVVVRGLRRGT